MLVLLPDALFEDDALIERGVLGDETEIVVYRELSADRIPDERWRAADALIVYYGVPFDRALIERLSACRILVRAGVGYDHIDIAACGARRIPVCNVPDYGTTEVADHAIALMLEPRPRPRLVSRPPARRSARRLVLGRRAAGPPAARRPLRRRRPRPDRDRGRAACPRPRHGDQLLRSLSARRRRARAGLPPGGLARGAARRGRRRQPALPAHGRERQPDRRPGARGIQAGGVPDQHRARRPRRPRRARHSTAGRQAQRRRPRRAALGAAGPVPPADPGLSPARALARRPPAADPARRLVLARRPGRSAAQVGRSRARLPDRRPSCATASIRRRWERPDRDRRRSPRRPRLSP